MKLRNENIIQKHATIKTCDLRYVTNDEVFSYLYTYHTLRTIRVWFAEYGKCTNNYTIPGACPIN